MNREENLLETISLMKEETFNPTRQPLLEKRELKELLELQNHQDFHNIKNSSFQIYKTISTISKIDKEITLLLRSNTDILRTNTKTFKLKNKNWRIKVSIKLPTIELRSIDLLESSIKSDKKISLSKNNRFNSWKLFSTQRLKLALDLVNWLKLEWSVTLTIQATSLSEKKLSFKKDLSTNKKRLDTISTTLFLGSEKIKLE